MAMEISGPGISPLDKVTTNSGSSTQAKSLSTSALTYSVELAMGVVCTNGVTISSSANDWSTTWGPNVGPGTYYMYFSTVTVSTGGSRKFTCNLSSSTPWLASLCCFR